MGVRSARQAAAWPLSVGLFLFGFAMTFLGGLSEAKGTSVQLLAGLLAFAGGSILTFAGYKRARAKADEAAATEDVIDLRQTGWGLAAFSLGLVLGAPAGIALRLYGPTPGAAAAPPSAPTTQTAARADEPHFAMQTNAVTACEQVARDLTTATDGSTGLRADVQALWRGACCPLPNFKDYADCKRAEPKP